MQAGVITFPGSNCDRDVAVALERVGAKVKRLWHADHELPKLDLIVLPGGFSYGDYLRCGAIAHFSPIMDAVKNAAENGQVVIGICNGFQVLCESGLLPGALVRNRDLHFICEHTDIRVESNQTLFTTEFHDKQILHIPIAHGEGCYIADEDVLSELEENQQVVFRYVDGKGEPTPESNPNGSMSRTKVA